MNERPLNSVLAYIVVCGQVALAIICVTCLCFTMFYKNYSDPVVLTCLVTLTGTLVGNLGSILGGPRSGMMGPTKTEIVNTPEKPVPVEEAEPKP